MDWELISAPDTFKSTYRSLHGASQAVSCSYGKQAFEIPQQPNLNLICEYEPSHDRTRNILVFLKHRFICQEIWGGWHQRSDLIDFNHTPEIGRARGLPATIIQRAPSWSVSRLWALCLFLRHQRFDGWDLDYELTKAVWNFKRDLGLNMPIGGIKPLFAREKWTRTLHISAQKLFPRSSMQYGFFIITKCYCQLPDNVDLLSAADCLLNV